MNEHYIGLTSGLAGTATVQHFSGDVGCVTTAPKQLGLSAAIQSLMEAAYESANLAENLASSLGLSWPCEGSDPAKPCSPIEYLRLATSLLCAANGKLADALQHINS